MSNAGQMSNSELFLFQQVILSLQILDALSDAPVTSLERVDVALRYPGETDFRAFNVGKRFLSGGYISFAGDPARIFGAGIIPDDTVEIRINIAAFRYAAFEQTVSISSNLVQLQDVVRQIDGQTHTVRALPAPLLRRTLSLQPIPVGLQGVVFADGDPQNPVAGVTLSVVAPAAGPSTVSDTAGRYRLDALPLTSSITLRVAGSTPQETEVQHLVNYRQPLNTLNITLP